MIDSSICYTKAAEVVLAFTESFSNETKFRDSILLLLLRVIRSGRNLKNFCQTLV